MKNSTPPPPVYVQAPPDPALAQQAAQAETDKTLALQDKLKGDTASMMSRYGAMMAMSSVVGAPATPAAVATPSDPILRIGAGY